MKTASASDVLKINNLVPKVGVLKEILDETPDVKTFRISTPEGERPFTPMPGQLGVLHASNRGSNVLRYQLW